MSNPPHGRGSLTRKLGTRALVSIGSRLGLPLKWKAAWSIGVLEGPTLFDLSPVPNSPQPALDASSVTDVPAVGVADPFWVEHEHEHLMFMEVITKPERRGMIGLARSEDGVRWHYDRIVLQEAFHQSYPHVFNHDGTWFMTPSGVSGGGIRLYQADSFPYKWRYVTTMVHGPYNDPTVIHNDGFWWLFTGVRNDELHLFYAQQLTGPWHAHRASPLRVGDSRNARPGGRIVSIDGRLIRFAQDDELDYGHMLRAFDISVLNHDDYAEVEHPQSPVLGPGAGWNGAGMHHMDARQLANGSWRAVVDGWRFQVTWLRDTARQNIPQE